MTTPSDANIYSYGNYYTWSAVIADTGNYGSNNPFSNTTSICPSGWRLPQGGDKTRIESYDDNDYWNLIVDGLNSGTNPANYRTQGRPFYNGSNEALSVSKALRAFPNNFLLSGIINGSIFYGRGSDSYYWSSTIYNGSDSYQLFLSMSPVVYPGTSYSHKYSGHPVRCVTGS